MLCRVLQGILGADEAGTSITTVACAVQQLVIGNSNFQLSLLNAVMELVM
jgi:hypothetical protein